MATHQELGGTSDEEFLERMVATHPERYGHDFWAVFAAHVAPTLPPNPVAIDLGCGPGLFLRDLGGRYPQASLYGYDLTPAMIAYAGQLPVDGGRPTLVLHDVATQPLPHEADSVHLVAMSSVLHVVDEPLPVLAEIRRVLTPGGTFLLHDWIRRPLRDYLQWRIERQGEDEMTSRRRGFRVFPVHNKYTTEDWHWLLADAGLTIRYQTQLRPTHQLFVTSAAGKAG